MTLIQLISEQTMPNLLAMMRLRPQKVVHLYTPRTKNQSYALKKAADKLDFHPEWEYWEMSDMPGIVETHNTINRIHEKELEKKPTSITVVNFTGGTKLMSIGAFAAAQKNQLPSLYVDTLTKQFIDGHTSSLLREILGSDTHFRSLYPSLRVDIIGVANGIEHISEGKDWQRLLPFARYLLENPDAEIALHQAIHGEQGLCPRGREPRCAVDWLPLLDQPIPVPVSLIPRITKCGIARQGPLPETILLPDATREELTHLAENHVENYHERYFQAIGPIQHTIALLTGAWWEIIVCDAAYQSGHVSSIRWSCLVDDGNGLSTETDILGLDGVELLYISCKRGGEKTRLLPLLEETKGRAATIGGSFNRRFLAILNGPRGKSYKELTRRAKVHGIRIITRDNILDPEVFSKHYRHQPRSTDS